MPRTPRTPITEDGEALTKQQREFAIWLTQTGTLQKACEVSKVAVRTAQRWMVDQAFLEEYKKVAGVAASIARTRLETGVSVASDLLVETVTDANADLALRLKAAETILKYTMKAEADSIERTSNPGVDLVRRPADVLPLKVAGG